MQPFKMIKILPIILIDEIFQAFEELEKDGNLKQKNVIYRYKRFSIPI